MSVDPIRSAGDSQRGVAGTQTAEFFEEHGRMVYGLCRALLRDPDEADDATQATFVSAFTSLLGGGVVREPAAWLATIARNECTARACARTREPLPLLDSHLAHTHGPDAELERWGVIEELQCAISELPPKQREAVVLRDLYGLRYTEVSAALGMSIASVESLLFRARRSLRVSLKPLASGALVVPVVIREGIAQAIPSFTSAGAAGGGAASGAVGLGLFAKLTGGPAALKFAAGVAAVTASGSVAVVGAEHAAKLHPQRTLQTASQAQADGAKSSTVPGLVAALFVPVSEHKSTSAAGGDHLTEHAGVPGRQSSENRVATREGSTGGSSERDSSEVGGSTRGGHTEDGGSTGAQSDGHDDDGTARRSGDSGSSGGAKASGDHDEPLGTTSPDSSEDSSDGAHTEDASTRGDGSGSGASQPVESGEHLHESSEHQDESSDHPDESDTSFGDSPDQVTQSAPA